MEYLLLCMLLFLVTNVLFVLFVFAMDKIGGPVVSIVPGADVVVQPATAATSIADAVVGRSIFFYAVVVVIAAICMACLVNYFFPGEKQIKEPAFWKSPRRASFEKERKERKEFARTRLKWKGRV